MNHTEELKQSVVTYIESQNTEYAIMINGEWGCGKTFFWKNVIEPYLVDRDKNPLYISLYGLDNLEQIINLISLELLPTFKNEFTQVANSALNTALKFLKIDPGIKEKAVDLLRQQKLYDNMSNFVLCFDDLERSSLEINQILGYINQFVEHYHFKTIILCNEQELNKNNVDYQRTKEKLISYTFYFNPSLEEKINQLIQLTDLQDFEYYNELILSLVKASHINNIRLIKNAFFIANTVFKNLNKFKTCESYLDKDSVKIDILKFIFSVTLEFTTGKADLNQLEQWVRKGYNYTDLISTQEKSYISQFIKKYYNQGYLSRQTTFLSIYNYLIKGYFDLELFEQELEKLINQKPTFKTIFLEDIRLLSDDEFYQAAQEYLDDLQSDKIYQPILLIKLLNKFINCSEAGLYNVPSEKIAELFRETIKRLEENNKLDYQDLDTEPFLFQNEPKSDYYREIKTLIIQANRKIYQQQLTEKANQLINLLKSEPNHFFLEVKTYNERPIFQYFDRSKLLKQIINLDNHYIYQFYLFIADRYSDINNHILPEREAIKDLTELLKSELKNREKKPSTYWLTLLYQELESAYQKLIS